MLFFPIIRVLRVYILFFFFFKHSAKNEPETKLRLGIGPEVEFVLTEHDTSSPRIPPVPAMEALWSEGYDQSL